MDRRAVFFSPMCLFDNRSGAAISVRTLLEVLAEAGWEVEAYTATFCDGGTEAPLGALLGAEGARDIHRGKIIRRAYRGVMHNILHAGTTVAGKFSQEHAARLAGYLFDSLQKRPADLALTYGGSTYSRQVQARVRPYARRLVFYLANDRYEDASLFAPMDAVLCPSVFLREHYRETLGLDCHVIRDPITPDYFLGPGVRPPTDWDALRRHGLITYINPSPPKGGTLFVRLALMALEQHPALTFLVTEGRMSPAEWRASGVDIAGLPNVLWLPPQRDMRRIYQRTSVLLFPTFWREASGRTVAEAQLSAIPVVASDRGGVPEQLNGGGFCLPVPPECEADHTRVPTEDEVQPWLDTLAGLLDDRETYHQACERALSASAPFHPERARPAARELLQRLAE